MKSIIIKSALLIGALLCILCFPVQVLSEPQQGTEGNELQLIEADTLEIQLGTDWANVEFQLKTDAGLYPDTIIVGQDGILRMEIGGSKSYVLSCMNSTIKVPEPSTQVSATTETKPINNNSETKTAEISDRSTATNIPILHIILFVGGMVAAIGVLITMHIAKKRREADLVYNDDEDE